MSFAERSISDALRSLSMEMGCPVGYLETQRVESHERADESPLLLTFARGAVGLVSLPSADACDHAFSLDFDPDELSDLIAMTRAETVGGVLVQLGDTTLVVDDEPASLLIVDHETLSHAFRSTAALVYDPRPTVLDMLQHEVSTVDWQKGGGGMEDGFFPFARSGCGSAQNDSNEALPTHCHSEPQRRIRPLELRPPCAGRRKYATKSRATRTTPGRVEKREQR